MRKYAAIVALAMSILALPSAARAGARIYVQIGPPAPIVEVRPVPPARHYVWVAGYYRWDGRAYVWFPGRWELPPAHYRAWVAGHWARHRHHGWYWVEGHWRR